MLTASLQQKCVETGDHQWGAFLNMWNLPVFTSICLRCDHLAVAHARQFHEYIKQHRNAWLGRNDIKTLAQRFVLLA
jgi:hypothetical protein